jgi:triphosphoribosyl-dephospho-CoA synthase
MDFAARDIADAARTACLLEAYVPKPGNVHPHASFHDLRFEDFVQAGNLCAPILGRAASLGVGQTALDCVRATRSAMSTNPNLGIILLLAPLAAVPPELRLADGIEDILARLTVDDARLVYEAIRLAKPGGLGDAPDQDIRDEPTETLLQVMQRASGHDLVARQYADRFDLVLHVARPLLVEDPTFATDPVTAVIQLQLLLLAHTPDSLIARKCGDEVAQEASRKAQRVLDLGWPDTPESRDELTHYDQWLRGDGNRRNPGTTADLIAATLFAAFRDRLLVAPELTSR